MSTSLSDTQRPGYAQELRRGVGTFSSFAAGFSFVSILSDLAREKGFKVLAATRGDVGLASSFLQIDRRPARTPLGGDRREVGHGPAGTERPR